MFQILKKANFDFMSRGKAFLIFSAIMLVVSLGILVVKGVDYGIEFTGGTEMQVKFAETPDLERIRGGLKSSGITGTPSVTTIGDPSLHEVMIRVGTTGEDGEEREVIQAVISALQSNQDKIDAAAGKVNLNTIEESRLRQTLAARSDVTPQEAATFAASFAEYRREAAIVASADDYSGLPGYTSAIGAALDDAAYFGAFALRSQSYIGPAIGSELLSKALWAIIGSLGGVLVYIGFRFQFQWGVAALAALAHDTIITLGMFSLFDQEMSLPVVAAFLTLIGYSVNDTVVVFDRIRENVKQGRGLQNFEATVNRSINQTLSRTVITSGLTWVVVLGLYVFGGSALRSFSFVLTIGVVVGTYSSICVASPLLIVFRDWTARRKDRQQAGRRRRPGTARKVRAT